MKKTSNTEWAIIRWIGDGRTKEDAPQYAAMRKTDSASNAQRQNIEKKTSNTEHRTPNTEWCGPEFRVSEQPQAGYGNKRRQKFDLEDRLLDFAVEIIELTETLPNTRAANHVAGQLLRSGTSPYGNHGEVEAAESLNDFIHKLKVCLKELRETRRWLRLVARLKHQEPPPNLPACLKEADELIRIFKASINTAEEKRR
jgi:four helix bundle protein